MDDEAAYAAARRRALEVATWFRERPWLNEARAVLDVCYGDDVPPDLLDPPVASWGTTPPKWLRVSALVYKAITESIPPTSDDSEVWN